MVRSAYRLAVGQGWCSPAEFWGMPPQEFWWLVDAKTPHIRDRRQQNEELYRMLMDARERESAENG
jgi:hypothetical protein